MTLRTISSGVTSSGLRISGGDELLVLSGGTTRATSVLSGGVEFLSAGALAESVKIALGGVLTGEGIATSAIVADGLVSGITISGGTLSISQDGAGGVARDVVLVASEEYVGSGGISSRGVIRGGSKPAGENIFSGGVAVGDRVGSRGVQFVDEGGNASGTVILSSGLLQDLGGSVSGARVSRGGMLYIAGRATGDVVSQGGVEGLALEAVVSGDLVLSGGTLDYAPTIVSGQTFDLNARVTSTTVLSGVTLASGAFLQLSGATVESGAVLSVGAGAPSLAGATTVRKGGRLLGPGSVLSGDVTNFGYISGLVVGSGSTNFLEGGGFAQADVIASGGQDIVFEDGVTSGEQVKRGGRLSLDGGGHGSGDTISAGGYLSLNNGGTAVGEIVLSGGTLVFGVELTSGETLTDSGLIKSATVFDGVDLARGAVMAIDTTVDSGATLSLTETAPPVEVEVLAGGLLIGPGPVSSGEVAGAASGVTVTKLLTILEGGVVFDDTIAAVGTERVSGNGVANRDRIQSGGRVIVLVDGFAESATISFGGRLRVEGGGHASRSIVLSGGIETVFAQGSAGGSVVTAGGYEFDFGTTLGSVIRSGGHERVGRNGLASGSEIGSGGHEGVASDGVAIATVLFNGGSLVVSSGGFILGGLTIHAGSATIDGIMSAGQAVSFAGTAGTLKLDNLSAFGAAISGFGGPTEKIDLGAFAFGATETAKWAQTGTSGTLTVHDGTVSGSLKLVGTYATSDFQLSTDNHGGTLIKAPAIPPAAAPATTRFTQAAAGLEGGRFAASVTAIHAGGSTLTGASPLVGVATSGR